MTAFTTDDGLTLEGRWSTGRGEGSGLVVLCHPHPQHGGTMEAPLMRSLAGRLSDAGMDVLRFNFRGVGRSEGGWGGGTGEIMDVAAAVAHARGARPGMVPALVGWSFGAVTALRWQAITGDTAPYAGVAPPVRLEPSMALPEPEDLAPARRLFVLGDRDQFCAVADLETYANSIGARLEVMAGSDHFFVFRDVAVGRSIADHLLGVGGNEAAQPMV